MAKKAMYLVIHRFDPTHFTDPHNALVSAGGGAVQFAAVATDSVPAGGVARLHRGSVVKVLRVTNTGVRRELEAALEDARTRAEAKRGWPRITRMFSTAEGINALPAGVALVHRIGFDVAEAKRETGVKKKTVALDLKRSDPVLLGQLGRQENHEAQVWLTGTVMKEVLRHLKGHKVTHVKLGPMMPEMAALFTGREHLLGTMEEIEKPIPIGRILKAMKRPAPRAMPRRL